MPDASEITNESIESPTKLTYNFARDQGVLLIQALDETVLIARKGSSFQARLEARRIADCRLSVEPVSSAEFEKHLAKIYAHGDLAQTAQIALEGPEDLSSLADSLPETSDLLESNDDAPVIRLINGIIQQAIKMRASDIHIEPFENRLAVRFRVDGALRDVLTLSSRLSSVLVSRVKVMAQLDIAKKRVPQDGRFSLKLSQRAIDVRVSTLPAQYGERIVMRILEKSSALMSLADLGMSASAQSKFETALKAPNGIILVTGPTGSGKTTSLYAALTALNDGSRNILSVEDPVEYALDGIGQTQVNDQVGMSFSTGLRAILRQDPDVVMVGEIRDPETAAIAVQASLTGHLVLSTVHTNSAIGAVTRLRDMGVESFLLSSTVTAIIAQRLVRRLCEDCKQPYLPTAGQLSELGLSEKIAHTFYKARGCVSCHNIGYLGRLGLYEVIVIDGVLKSMVYNDVSEQDMASYALSDAQSLLGSGIEHICAGRTTYDEVFRVCRLKTTEA